MTDEEKMEHEKITKEIVERMGPYKVRVRNAVLCYFGSLMLFSIWTEIFMNSFLIGFVYDVICLLFSAFLRRWTAFICMIFVTIFRFKKLHDVGNYQDKISTHADRIGAFSFILVPVLFWLILSLFCNELYINYLFLPAIVNGCLLYGAVWKKWLYPLSSEDETGKWN